MKRFLIRLKTAFNILFKDAEQVVHIGIVRDKYGRTKVYLDGTEYKKSNTTICFWVRNNDLNKLSWEIKKEKENV